MNEEIKSTIEITEGERQFDTQVKRLIGRRSILGHIVVRVIDAYKDMSPAEAAELIEGDVLIGVVPVDPGETNSSRKSGTNERGDRLRGLNTEETEVNEGCVRYDILFYVRTPDGLSRIIVNVEAQRNQPSEYHILNRALYYVCRMVSSQKEREFEGQKYDNIKNNYSVWICMNEPENYMHEIHLANRQLIGSMHMTGNLDMLHVIVIGITEEIPEAGEELGLHRLLGALISMRQKSSRIIHILEQEYYIPDVDEMNEEVRNMCNFGEALVEEGRAEGRAEEQSKSLRMLCEMVAEDGYPIGSAVKRAAVYGVMDEADLRNRAQLLGITL